MSHCYLNDQNLTFLKVYQESHWNRLSDHSLCRGKVMSFESDKARKRSIYIPCRLIKYSFPLNLFSARSEKLTQWLQIVAGFVINSGSSQFQTGSSPTQIFTCLFLYKPPQFIISNILRPLKLVSAMVRQCSASGQVDENYKPLTFFCVNVTEVWNGVNWWLDFKIVDRFILVVQFCIIS